MLCGLALNCYLWKGTHVAWTWYVTLGATTTFVVGYLASLSRFAASPQGNLGTSEVKASESPQGLG
jgi:hypothetical protein